MYSKTALLYLLSGENYYKEVDSHHHSAYFHKSADKEIKNLSKIDSFRDEEWHGPYYSILYNVFCVNLIARYYERLLKSENLCPEDRFDRFAPATYFAVKAFNKYKKSLREGFDKNLGIEHLIYAASSSVNNVLKENRPDADIHNIINASTAIGIELEFSNVGTKGGNFFEPGTAALRNFSKYHHYHLLRFMWRFGAYIDSNFRAKQLIKKGGFLEYTFMSKADKIKTTRPLTPSPSLAAGLISEGTLFTPVKPHSLHLTVELNKTGRTRDITFEELIFFLILTADIDVRNGKTVETRIAEGDIKGLAVYRDRFNKDGVKQTLEYAHMRLSRKMARNGIYEPLTCAMIAFKNTLSFSPAPQWRRLILDWALNPRKPKTDVFACFEIIEEGLLMEKTLPAGYIKNMISKLKDYYQMKSGLIDG